MLIKSKEEKEQGNSAIVQKGLGIGAIYVIIVAIRPAGFASLADPMNGLAKGGDAEFIDCLACKPQAIGGDTIDGIDGRAGIEKGQNQKADAEQRGKGLDQKAKGMKGSLHPFLSVEGQSGQKQKRAGKADSPLRGPIKEAGGAAHQQIIKRAQALLAQISVKQNQLKADQHQAVGGIIAQRIAGGLARRGIVNAGDKAGEISKKSCRQNSALEKKDAFGDPSEGDSFGRQRENAKMQNQPRAAEIIADPHYGEEG